MSKHESRKDRWQEVSPNELKSLFGRVYYSKDGWYAEVHYLDKDKFGVPHDSHYMTVGPYKRSRNAMMGAEEVARKLKREGKDINFFKD